VSYKNRERDKPSFANINLLGKCNVQCFFCLGEDIPQLLRQHNQLKTHFSEWANFRKFLRECRSAGISKIYLTGQNTDPLLYAHLKDLIAYLQDGQGFRVGIRTNGYLALKQMDVIRTCYEEVGYSIHTINPTTSQMILGRRDIPNWPAIIAETCKAYMPVRVSVVINRCNYHEFWDLMRYLAQFDLPYVQIRKVSTDTRHKTLAPDQTAYETLYTEVSKMFPLKQRLWGDAEVYDVFGVNTCWWRTVKTTVNSWNYFTDGTISKSYFIVEGYVKNSNTAKDAGYQLPEEALL
jgi:molybdenum cofactor biosynthesis enzyme MoaA